MKDFSRPAPKVGETIYIPPNDDTYGGRAVVRDVSEGISGGEPTMYVSTWSAPLSRHNWEYLSADQDKLAQQYGDSIAHPDQHGPAQRYRM